MIALDRNYTAVEEVPSLLVDGLLVVHQKSSGSFIMLNELLVSIHDDRKAAGKEELRVSSINELHPLYNDFIKTYGITHSSAVIVIVDSQISELLFSPISKYKLIDAIKTFT